MALLSVHLNARLQPRDRDRRFEDPLQEALDADAPGGEVIGGGTQLSEDGEPVSCDLELETAGDTRTAVAVVVRALRRSGAPKGSTIRVDDGDPIEIGIAEGVGLYLDGTDIAPEILDQHPVNDFVRHIKQVVARNGQLFSFWEGPKETALYFYGPSSERLEALLAEAVRDQPLANRFRLAKLA